MLRPRHLGEVLNVAAHLALTLIGVCVEPEGGNRVDCVTTLKKGFKLLAVF